jgi:hypothetical protein
MVNVRFAINKYLRIEHTVQMNVSFRIQIIINQKIDCPEGKVLLYSSNPFKTYNQIAKDHRYYPI